MSKVGKRNYIILASVLLAFAVLIILVWIAFYRPFDVQFTMGAAVTANLCVIATACFLLFLPQERSRGSDLGHYTSGGDLDQPICNPITERIMERTGLVVLLMFCIGALTFLAKA